MAGRDRLVINPMDENRSFEMTSVPVGTLRLADYNPRRMSEGEMNSLKKSIQRFGFVDPVIVNRRQGKGWKASDRSEVIVGGHQRVRAARELGLKTVPVVYVDLQPDDEKLLNLALNKISGEFDLQKLAAILRDLRGAQADLDASGFSPRAVSKAIAEAERELLRSLPPDEDDVPDLPRTPRTTPGELVVLGPHRLLCGDATMPEDLKRLLGDETSALCWTD